MSKLTLTDIVNLQNETTAVSAMNNNSTLIENAIENTLSRDGTGPNQMHAALDMNSQQIYNLPAPSTVNSPARLIDVVTNPTIVIPGTGTSGHVVPYLDGNNTWSGTNTFSPAINNNLGSFFIHNNSIATTYTPPNPNTYRLFQPSTLKFNQGSYWANNRFTPPAGTNIISLAANLWVTDATHFAGNIVAKWIKNFTIDGSGFIISGTDVFAGIGCSSGNTAGQFTIHSTGWEKPTTGDYYGLFTYIDAFPLGSTSITIDGNPAHTYMSGAIVG